MGPPKLAGDMIENESKLHKSVINNNLKMYKNRG